MTLAPPAVETPSVGVDELVERFRVAYRLRQYVAEDFVDHFVERGYLERDGELVRVTELGRRMAGHVEGARLADGLPERPAK